MGKWDKDFWGDDEFMDNMGRRCSPRGGTDWVDPRRTRTKSEWPYSYDAFYIWREKNLEGAHAEYHDRMQMWDWEKYQEAFALVKDKGFSKYTRAEVSEFLTAYHGKPIKAVAVAEGCNQSNGYPYWIFWFRDIEEEE